MEFVAAVAAVCAVLLVIAPLLISGCARSVSDTETVDGGVIHHVDMDAPKTVKSTEIRSFSCSFSATDLSVTQSPIAGRYYTLYAAEGQASYEAISGSSIRAERKFAPDGAFFKALQQIVAKYDLAQYNGQFYTVSGLPPHLGAKLDITYASGESIQCSNNQSCFIPLEAMEELVALFYPEDAENKVQE